MATLPLSQQCGFSQIPRGLTLFGIPLHVYDPHLRRSVKFSPEAQGAEQNSA